LATNSITNPTIHKNKATQKIIKNYVLLRKKQICLPPKEEGVKIYSAKSQAKP